MCVMAIGQLVEVAGLYSRIIGGDWFLKTFLLGRMMSWQLCVFDASFAVLLISEILTRAWESLDY